MNPGKLLLFAVMGWSGLGLIGTVISLKRREQAKARRGLIWIAGIWAVYLIALIAVSVVQPQRILAMGQEQCFDEMCFAVTRVQEVPGFLIQDGSRLVRVSVRVRNRAKNKTRGDGSIRAYLVDARDRRWEESAGVNGVPLTVHVVAGGSVMSEPVFHVAGNASELKLVFTHGWRLPDMLVIGGSDSLLHRRTAVKLGE